VTVGSVGYEAHGLLVQSDLPLRLPLADRAGPPDVVLRRGADRVIPAAEPAGELLAALCDQRRRLCYSITRDHSHTVMRYPGLGEFVGDRLLDDVVVHLAPGADDGVLSVLASGAVLAVHLMLRGNLVLHASAVRIGDMALAFVGASGMGKSTLATLLCADGNQLIADDVVHVCMPGRGGHPAVFPGSIESRLRHGASALAEGAPAASVRRTTDGRIAIQLKTYSGAALPLAGCVVPFPNHHSGEIVVSALSRSQGLRRLLQFPRVVGWVEREWHLRNFQALADLVNLVPVFEAQVPWGPPFRPGLARQLQAKLNLREPASAGGQVRVAPVGTW
jgi:hypothetical protein